jgi:hypothetical protein
MKTHQRPKIVCCGFAQQVIQATSKETIVDGAQAPHDIPATTTAYEADE